MSSSTVARPYEAEPEPAARKPRLLFLHGWSCHRALFRKQCQKLLKKFHALSSSVEFVFAQAPHVLPDTSFVEIDGVQVEVTNNKARQASEDDDDDDARVWWFYNERDKGDCSSMLGDGEAHNSYHGWADSLAYLDRLWHEEGPFDGVLGHSQGACAAHLLAALHASQVEPWRRMNFAVYVCGFVARDKTVLLNSASPSLRLPLPSLHVFGTADRQVPPEHSRRLAELFAEPVLLEHPKGHFVPTRAEETNKIAQFVGEHLDVAWV